MTNADFKLEVRKSDNGEYIYFANLTKKFVEVMITLDGMEIMHGLKPEQCIRGFGFTPGLEKNITKMQDGRPLKFHVIRGGTVKAFIFAGVGKYKDADLDKPTFLRHRLVKKFSFHRTSDSPIAVLEAKY